MTRLLLGCHPGNCIQRIHVYIAQHVSQIAKQMDAALRGLHKTPDTKVKFTFIYLGVLVNMMNKTEHV